MRALAEALVGEMPSDPDTMRELLRFDDPEVAFRAICKWRGSHLEAVLVVDQFEELFTLNPPEVQERFSDLLGRLAGEGDVHVLLSLRDDFLIRCHEQKPLESVFQNLTPILALGGDDLRRALTEPAKKEGFVFEDEALVAEMLEAVQEARGALPLLAFAVARLWEQRDRERKLLTRKAYEEIGGVAGSLAQHAEQTLERIGLEREPIVRELFRNLVTAQWTRAVADREQLLSVLPDQAVGAQVLDQLIDARLLTSYEVKETEADARTGESPARATSRQRIEIVHESLLRAWPRLVRWQAQDEEGAVLRDQLKQAAHLWEEKSRSPDLLWSGDAFQEFELWRRRYPGKLTAVEGEFAEAMAHRARRRRQLRRMAVAGVVAASLVVALVVGVSRQQAVRHAERADREALRAEASKLLALAEVRLEEDPTEALALTTASLDLADTQEARLFAVRVLSESPPATEVSAGTSVARFPAFSPDGRRLATIGFVEEGKVWSDAGEGPLVLPGHEPNPSGGLAARWLDGGYLATGNIWGARRVHIWSIPSAEPFRTIEFGAPTRWWAGVGSRLLTATAESGDGAGRRMLLLRSWEIPGGDAEDLGQVAGTLGSEGAFEPHGRGWIFARGREVRLRPLPAGVAGPDHVLGRHPETVDLLFVARDRLVSRDRGGESRIWSFRPGGPKLEKVIPRPENASNDVVAEPSGRWLFEGGFSGRRRMRLWDTTAFPRARSLELRRSGTWRLAQCDFRPGGDWVVVTTHDLSRLTLWPLGRARPSVLDGYSGLVRPVAFSPNSRWLAAAVWGPRADEVGVRLFPLPGRGDGGFRTIAEGGAANIVFDPGGRHVVRLGGTNRPGGVYVIPLDGSPARELPGPDEADTIYGGLAVSPSGRRVAMAFLYGTAVPKLRVWDVETGGLQLFELPPPASPAVKEGYQGSVSDLHFTDDSTLYSAGDGGIRRWNVDTGSHEVVFAPNPEEHLTMSMDAEGKVALARVWGYLSGGCRPVELHDLTTGQHQPRPEFGTCVTAQAIDPSGRVAATGDNDGIVRVTRLSGGPPHLLMGHEGPVQYVAVSPDLRWVASTGEDNTLRLWPMPDLEKPPLHTLPHGELIAKLKSLTNLRAVRDPESPTGWTIELGPFPGWRDIPTW
jgi:WD40 repeat protein